MLYLIGFAGTLTVWLVWLAFNRPDRRRRPWRMVATVVASAALLGSIFPPTFSQKTNAAEAILLTEGFAPDSLAKLLRQIEGPIRVFSYRQPAAQAETITRLAGWRQQFPQIREVHLLGYGLPIYERKVLDSVLVVPHLSLPPMGVTHADWTRSVVLGEPLRVSGQYRFGGQSAGRLQLSVVGLGQDSVEIHRQETNGQLVSTAPFTLQHTPKEVGRFLYQLTVRAGQDVLSRETIPVEVRTPPPLRLLVLASFPTFEIRFLKDALAKQGHALTLRLATSQGKFQTEWLNTPEISVQGLSPTLLREFDLVLADVSSLESLPTSEGRFLAQAISTEGLGLLTWPTELPLSNELALLRAFSLKKVSEKETRPIRVRWSDRGTGAPEIPALPYALATNTRTKPLVTDADDRAIVAYVANGWGKVGLSLLPDTYRWALEGKNAVYQLYWASLLRQLAKPQLASQAWTLPSIPFVHQPADVQLLDFSAPADSMPTAQVTFTSLTSPITTYFRQEPSFSPQFTTTYWPDSVGWHAVGTSGGQSYSFYTFEANAWKSWQQTNILEQTQRWLQAHPMRAPSPLVSYTRTEIPVVYFFLLFLLSSGFLWLEEKL